VYATCCLLYYCGPVPIPFSPPKTRVRQNKKSKKGGGATAAATATAKAEPGKNEDWTKEMYEQRRKEKKVKGRGVLGEG